MVVLSGCLLAQRDLRFAGMELQRPHDAARALRGRWGRAGVVSMLDGADYAALPEGPAAVDHRPMPLERILGICLMQQGSTCPDARGEDALYDVGRRAGFRSFAAWFNLQ